MPKEKFRIASGRRSGKLVHFSLADRKKVELAFGQSLPDAAWTKIVMTTNWVLVLDGGPRGPVLDTVLPKIAAFKKAAMTLKALLDPENDATVRCDGFGSLKELHQAHLQNGPSSDTLDETDLVAVLLRSVNFAMATSEYALAHLNENEPYYFSFEERAFWTIWVSNIAMILRQAGLRVSVRKDFVADKGPSAFVSLVAELQRLLPETWRRHMPSEKSSDKRFYLDALSQAVYRALKENEAADTLLMDALANLSRPT